MYENLLAEMASKVYDLESSNFTVTAIGLKLSVIDQFDPEIVGILRLAQKSKNAQDDYLVLMGYPVTILPESFPVDWYLGV